MNRAERGAYALHKMDDLAARQSPIHSLCPLAKLLMTIAYLITVLSFPKYDLSGVAVMLLYPALLFPLSSIEVRTCFYQLRFVLPLVMAVGLFNPFFDRQTMLTLGAMQLSGGVISMLTLMGKGVLCLMASFLLMATTSIDALCAALRKLRLPGMVVTLLLLTCRYVGIMAEEVAVMTDAYHLRAPGQKGIRFSAWGSFLGQLLLRSMDRGTELYSGMLLRGFQGEFHYAEGAPWRGRDTASLAVCVPVFLLVRLVPVAGLLGSLLVR